MTARRDPDRPRCADGCLPRRPPNGCRRVHGCSNSNCRCWRCSIQPNSGPTIAASRDRRHSAVTTATRRAAPTAPKTIRCCATPRRIRRGAAARPRGGRESPGRPCPPANRRSARFRRSPRSGPTDCCCRLRRNRPGPKPTRTDARRRSTAGRLLQQDRRCCRQRVFVREPEPQSAPMPPSSDPAEKRRVS